MSAVDFDKDVLATLTPEELAAIQEPAHSKAEIDALRSVAGDDGPDTDPENPDGDDDGDPNETLDADGNPVKSGEAGAPSADDAAAAAAKSQEPAAKTDEPAPVATQPRQDQPVVYDAALPEDYDQKVQDLKARQADLRSKFKAGELDLDAFDEQNAALDEEREVLTVARAKAETAASLNAQNAQAAWRNTITGFFDATKLAGGPDYHADEAKRNDLDMFVKALANDAKNENKPASWFLEEAHKRTMALHGLTVAKNDPKPPAADPVAAKNERRKPNLSVVQKTLAHVPGGDGPGDVGGDEFANLDGLKGEALEDAIARMSPAQRQKFVHGG